MSQTKSEALSDTSLKSTLLHKEFIAAVLSSMLIMCGSVMFVLLPAYWQSNGMEKWEIGMADSVFWLVSVFVQPWLGRWLDEKGRCFFYTLGAFLVGLVALIYCYTPVLLIPMLILRTLHGLGFVFFLTASWTWVADYSPPDKTGQIFGVFGLSSLVSGALGPGLAEWITAHWGYPEPFVAGCILVSLGGLLSLALKERRPKSHDESKIPPFHKLLTAPHMLGVTVASIGFGLAVGSLFAFIAPYLDELQITGVGTLFAGTVIVSGVFRLLAGPMTDRLGPEVVVFPALLALAIGSLGLGLVGYSENLKWQIPSMVVCGLFAGIGYAVIYPSLNALAINRLVPEARGRGLSIVTAAIDSGSFAGAALAGVVAHNWGYEVAFITISITVALSALAFMLVEYYDLLKSAHAHDIDYIEPQTHSLEEVISPVTPPLTKQNEEKQS